jgi:hypothetical protein
MEALKTSCVNIIHFCAKTYEKVEQKIDYIDFRIEKWNYDHFSPNVAYVATRILQALPYVAFWGMVSIAPAPIALGICTGLIVTSFANQNFFSGRKTINSVTGSAILDAINIPIDLSLAIGSRTTPDVFLIMTMLRITSIAISLLIAKHIEHKMQDKKAASAS